MSGFHLAQRPRHWNVWRARGLLCVRGTRKVTLPRTSLQSSGGQSFVAPLPTTGLAVDYTAHLYVCQITRARLRILGSITAVARVRSTRSADGSLTDNTERSLVDYVGRLEAIQEDDRSVAQALGLDIGNEVLPHENAMARRRICEHFTEREEAVVPRVCAEDFGLFDYSARSYRAVRLQLRRHRVRSSPMEWNKRDRLEVT